MIARGHDADHDPIHALGYVGVTRGLSHLVVHVSHAHAGPHILVPDGLIVIGGTRGQLHRQLDLVTVADELEVVGPIREQVADDLDELVRVRDVLPVHLCHVIAGGAPPSRRVSP